MRFLISLILLFSSGAAGQSLDAAMDRVDKAAAGFKSINCGVRRQSHTAVINENTVDTGTMLLKKVKARDIRMLVKLTHPDEKSVALAGKKLEIYFPKINTVQEYDVGKHRAMLDQFFLLGFGTSRKELEASYNIRLAGGETIGGRKTDRLELIPKSKEVLQHLKTFELWVAENGYPVQQKFHLPGGDYMLVTYSEVQINPSLSDAALKLQLPRGVKREFPQR